MSTHRVAGLAKSRPPIVRIDRSAPVWTPPKHMSVASANWNVFEDARTFGRVVSRDRHMLATGNKGAQRPGVPRFML